MQWELKEEKESIILRGSWESRRIEYQKLEKEEMESELGSEGGYELDRCRWGRRQRGRMYKSLPIRKFPILMTPA